VLLAKHFAAQLGRELRKREAVLSDEAVAALRAHRWPGNVRELENAIERACILADSATLTPADLGLARPSDARKAEDASADFDTSGTLSEAAERAARAVERRKIADSLRAHEGNKTRAAEELGVSYKTLLTKIKEYNL
jgi:DNA-binding NtrC family response regulator